MRANMEDVPDILLKRWIHSNEEDSGDISVYRPDSYDLPPARARHGFELTADGRFVELGPGPTDALQAIGEGHWRMDHPQRLHVSFSLPMSGESGGRSDIELEIVESSDDILKVRRRPG
jgi:hypothetical protein